MLKYSAKNVDIESLKKHQIPNVFHVEKHDNNVLLVIRLHNEESFGWMEDKEFLPDLIPLYEEIKKGNHQFLSLISPIHDKFTGKGENALKPFLESNKLSPAQKSFLENIQAISKECIPF